jgi:hypothetical protein
LTGIFTLDSVVAFTMATIVLTSCLFLLTEPKYAGGEYIYQVSTDVVSILDENGGLQELAGGGNSRLNELKSVLPTKLCIEVMVLNSSDDIVFMEESGCPTVGKYTVSRRSFVKDRVFYIAEVKTWFK